MSEGCLLWSPDQGWLGSQPLPPVSWEHCPHGKGPGFPPDPEASAVEQRMLMSPGFYSLLFP